MRNLAPDSGQMTTLRAMVGFMSQSTGSLQRVPAEQAMAHLAAIVESSEDAIVSKTLDGMILSWNASAQRLYGYEAGEIVGQPMTLLVPNDRGEEESEILARISRGERVEHFETVRRRKTGEMINVSLTISPIRAADGSIVGASHVARNVTERQQMNEESAQLAAIVQSSEDAIVSKTPDGTIRTWNKGAERVYGFTAVEAIGRPMLLVIPEDRAEEEAAILERIGRGEKVEHFETLRRKKTGELITVSLTISPIYDKSGRAIGISHIARDVSQNPQTGGAS